MYAHVLRTETDCTNNGVSSQRWIFQVITEEKEKSLQTDKPETFLVLVYWQGKPHHLRPLRIMQPQGTLSEMHGGNYANIDYSVSRLPLPIHDRFETPEMYRALSI